METFVHGPCGLWLKDMVTSNLVIGPQSAQTSEVDEVSEAPVIHMDRPVTSRQSGSITVQRAFNWTPKTTNDHMVLDARLWAHEWASHIESRPISWLEFMLDKLETHMLNLRLHDFDDKILLCVPEEIFAKLWLEPRTIQITDLENPVKYLEFKNFAVYSIEPELADRFRDEAAVHGRAESAAGPMYFSVFI